MRDEEQLAKDVYNNPDFGTVYNTLVNEGSVSYVDALKKTRNN